MKHPLTDKIIEEELLDDQDELLYRTCFPQSYYEGDFRAGADWQLEQVMKWLKSQKDYPGSDYYDLSTLESIECSLRQAMRPTNTQEDN